MSNKIVCAMVKCQIKLMLNDSESKDYYFK